jgi:hypothetical protein
MWRRNESAVIDGVAAVVPAGVLDDPGEVVVLRVGRREGAEVVLADEHRGRGLEALEVERLRMPEGAVHLEGRAGAQPQDPVPVGARACRVTRVEAVGSLVGVDHRHVGGQHGVQRLGGALRRRPALHGHGDDVREGMHSGVRPAGDCELLGRRVELAERAAHLRLHGSLARLPRPAAEAAAVVLHG